MRIGVLAFQGSVIEHVRTTQVAAAKLKIECEVVEIRTKKDLEGVTALIIPGGESTVMHKLAVRAGIFEDLKKIKNIFGTCAGAIMLAKKIHGEEEEQKTLGLMNIEVDRNAYGTQIDSFEKKIETSLGNIHAIFIRAPRISLIGPKVKIIARSGNDILACQEHTNNSFYLAFCFHPELTTTKVHEYFLRNLLFNDP